MFRLRPLLALLALASVLTFAVVDLADARAGGGFSSGSRGSRTFSMPSGTRTAPNGGAPIERSITQPGTPRSAPVGGGFFGRPGFFGGGFFGGLAAGFLGAGLFGLLFGHGLFGGLGGLSSVIGLLLQIALVVLIGRMIFNWWQRRNAPAFVGAGSSSAMSNPYGGYGGGGQPAGGATGGSDEVTLSKDDYDTFERLLGEIQVAYGREDLAALRNLATPEVLSYFSEDLGKNASRGVVNRVSDVKLLQGDLAEAWREGDTEYATVSMRYSLVDQMVDRASGRVVEGGDQPSEATEFWTFMRTNGGRWILSAIQQTT